MRYESLEVGLAHLHQGKPVPYYYIEFMDIFVEWVLGGNVAI